jgi:uncharacterized membrane protein YeaQ/YmgE (transglycosylase-associated protein family)
MALFLTGRFGGFGMLVDIIVGIVGALIGAWLGGVLGLHLGSGIIGSPAVVDGLSCGSACHAGWATS